MAVTHLSISCSKSKNVSKQQQHHTERFDDTRKHRNEMIDPTKSKDNINLRPDLEGSYQERFESIVNSDRYKGRRKKDGTPVIAENGKNAAVKMVQVTVNIGRADENGKRLDDLSDDEITELLKNDVYPMMRDWFGGDANVLGAAIHLDESKPHLHLDIVPITEDGKLSAKKMLGNENNMRFHQKEWLEQMQERRPDLNFSRKQNSKTNGLEMEKLKELTAIAEEKGEDKAYNLVSYMRGLDKKRMDAEWEKINADKSLLEDVGAEQLKYTDELNAFAEQLNGVESELNQREMTLNGRERVLKGRENALNERERHIEEQVNTAFRERETALKGRERVLKGRENALNERERHIEEQVNTAFRERETALKGRENTLDEWESRIEEQVNTAFRERETALKGRENMLDERESRIEEQVNTAFRERETALKGRENTLNEREHRIEERVRGLDDEVESRVAKIKHAVVGAFKQLPKIKDTLMMYMKKAREKDEEERKAREEQAERLAEIADTKTEQLAKAIESEDNKQVEQHTEHLEQINATANEIDESQFEMTSDELADKIDNLEVEIDESQFDMSTQNQRTQ